MQEIRRTTETTVQATPQAESAPLSDTGAAPAAHPLAVLARLIYFILGVIETILALRFILALLGANPANGFAHFIYSISEPLARPFFSLFNYQPSQGMMRLEMGTLVAMAVYALVAWGIVALIRALTKRDDDIIAA